MLPLFLGDKIIVSQVNIPGISALFWILECSHKSLAGEGLSRTGGPVGQDLGSLTEMGHELGFLPSIKLLICTSSLCRGNPQGDTMVQISDVMNLPRCSGEGGAED